jgi:ketosteroid isomerase-like protein
MRNIIYFIGASLSLLMFSCENNVTGLKEKAKQEIAQAEKDFQKMTTEKGIKAAFPYYADSSAVVKGNNDSLIKNKDGIANLYSLPVFEKTTLTWSPDFIDASDDGTLGYTYGKYVWQSKDSTGKVSEFKGVFHTVWKKQKDGSWKYVWD